MTLLYSLSLSAALMDYAPKTSGEVERQRDYSHNGYACVRAPTTPLHILHLKLINRGMCSSGWEPMGQTINASKDRDGHFLIPFPAW
jgi:hypothetical protein